MTKKILARPDLLIRLPATERALYEKALHHFMEHHSHGTNLEKLHAKAKYYSIRVNKGTRLILTPIKRNKKQVWLWVDTLDKHQYDQLAQKNTHWLAQQIEKTLEHNIDILPGHPEPEVPVEIEPEGGIEYHNQQFILFDESQKKAQDTQLPLLISGAPGSGKSSVALSLLRQFISKNPPSANGEKKRLLYVAQSEALVRNMHEEWLHIQAIEGIDPDAYDIEFKTPKQLFEQYYKEREETPPELVKQDYFNSWFADYITTQINLLPPAPASSSKKKHLPSAEEEFLHQLLANPELAYQEFRTISGYASFDQYNENVGSKHSLFELKNDRKWLWDAYQHYTETLHEKNGVDLFFHPIRSNRPPHLVVVDEAQDLSRLILRSLDKITNNHQIAYCIGDHQRVHDSRSILPFIKSIFWELAQKISVNHQPLSASYRCPERITQTANAVLQLKYHATGGADKNELLFIHSSEHFDEPGSVHWIEKDDELQPLINDKDNADFAVITSPEFKAEAQRLFGAERVFTPEEIKGLEYEHVLLYKLLDSKPYKAANQIIDEHLTLHNNPEGLTLPKSSSGSVRHNTAFNELFVAMTRAQRSVSIYQPDSRAITRIRTPLKNFVTANNQPKVHAQAIPTMSSPEDWNRRAQVLRAQEQEEKALLIEARPALPSKEKPQSLTTKKTEKKTKKQETQPIKPSPEINERNEIILGFLTCDQDAASELLMHPKAEEYLFDTLLSQVDPSFPTHSLYSFISYRNGPILMKSLHALLQNMEKTQKTPLKSITLLMRLICRIEDTPVLPILKKSLLAMLLNTENIDDKIFLFIKRHLQPDQLDAFLDTKYKEGHTLLYSTIKNGNLSMLRNLHLINNFENRKDEHGYTAVHFAAQLQQIGILVALHKWGADMNMPNNENTKPIDIAASMDAPTYALTALHKLGASITEINAHGETLLHTACLGCSIEILNQLHQWRLDLNARDKKNRTPIYNTIISGRDELFLEMIKLGAQLNVADDEGNTLAHIAVQRGDLSMLGVLYQMGNNMTQKNHKGEAPVHTAAYYGKMDVLKRMRRLHIDLNTENANNATIAHIIAARGTPEQMVQLDLIGVKLNGQDRNGLTPAHYAAIRKNIHMLVQLHQLGIHLNTLDHNGTTPLEIVTLHKLPEHSAKIFAELCKIYNKSNRYSFFPPDLPVSSTAEVAEVAEPFFIA